MTSFKKPPTFQHGYIILHYHQRIWVIQHLVFSFFYFIHSDRCIVITHCEFNLCFSSSMLNIFSCAYCNPFIFFSGISLYVLCPVFNWVIFYYWVWEFFRFSKCWSFIWYVIWKYFLPIYSLYFQSLQSFKEQKLLILIKFNLWIFPSVDHAFNVKSRNSLPCPES